MDEDNYYEDYDDEQEYQMEQINLLDYQNPLERYSQREFQIRYRFSKETVIWIVREIAEEITRKATAIPALLQICIALRFFCTGSYQICIGDMEGASQPSVSRIIRSVSTSIAKMKNRFIYIPTAGKLAQINLKFRELSRINGVMGAIDCTHVRIMSPGGENAVNYVNRKGFYSINVQVVTVPDLKFINIVARYPGSAHDSRIFQNSKLYEQFQSGQIPGILLGDGGYPAKPFLLTPVLNPQTQAEMNYNLHHAKARNVVERSFGVFKKRFSCLGPDSRLRLKVDTVLRVIMACSILHNLAIERNENEELSEKEDEGAFNQGTGSDNVSGAAFRRTIIHNYFA